jgi:hypothetical protein
VEVNQRALIDKVLARYSGEFTVFRELLQNSDDAQSKRVEIRFLTQAALDDGEGSRGTLSESATPLPDLKTVLVRCMHTYFYNSYKYCDISVTSGPLRMMEWLSGKRTGTVSKRLVCNLE